jgi:hypothetical protein
LLTTLRLIHGDILHHLPGLFDVTHIYSFDWVIPSTVKMILLHLLAFMSRTESQLKVFITTIDSIPLQYGRLMHMTDHNFLLHMSQAKSHKSKTMHVYCVTSTDNDDTMAIAICRRDDDDDGQQQQLYVRAMKRFLCNEIIVRSVVTDHYYSSSNGYHIYRQFMLGRDLHILDATRYIAVVVDDVRLANVMFKRLDDHPICLVATRNVASGEELLVSADIDNDNNNNEHCVRPLCFSS